MWMRKQGMSGAVHICNRRGKTCGRAMAASDKKSTLRELEAVTAKDVFDAAKAGDELALEIVDTQARILGRALAQIACVVDPEIFVIGGGVSKAGSILTDSVKKYFEHYEFHACNRQSSHLHSLAMMQVFMEVHAAYLEGN